MLVKDFYADPRRAGSDEVEFGSAWRTQGVGPWHVVWLEATGELAAFSVAALQGWEPTGMGGDVGLLIEGAVEGVTRFFRHGSPRPRPASDEVVVIGVEADLFRLRGALIGWEQHMPEENGLAWLAERVDELTLGQTTSVGLRLAACCLSQFGSCPTFGIG